MKARYLGEVYLDSLWRRNSYSQCGEDLVLLELLHRRSIRKGFYVDIGAFAPKQYSNTYLLYKKGWKGINIDAMPGSMNAFNRARKRDINLEVAISDRQGEATFYTWGTPAVTNTLSRRHAEHFGTLMGQTPGQIHVRTELLSEVLGRYNQHFSVIDVMNVDVEDHTLQVLRSNDWSKYRPTILLVEIEGHSVDDITRTEEHAFLKSKGYTMCAWTNPTVFYERF